MIRHNIIFAAALIASLMIVGAMDMQDNQPKQGQVK